MKEYIIHLAPRSNYEVALHSDTLFGAICWGIRMLFGEERLVQVIDEYKTSPPFLLSSAFPFKFDGKDYKYFLPKPVLKPLTIKNLAQFIEKAEDKKETYHSKKLHAIEIANKYKKFKKIKLIGISSFRKILKRPDEAELFTDYLDKHLIEPRYCRNGVEQKNSLDRLTNSTTGSGNTFYIPEMAYREKFGLYFLMKSQNINEYIKPVLHFLEDSGIGPNARTGKNWFKVEVNEKAFLNRNNSHTGNSFITLSRYIKNEPINAEDSFYQSYSVRSKVESRLEFAGEDVWKHRVSYFTAGSVINPENKAKYFGKLAPVKSIGGKTIYQYGYAYPVWLNRGGKNEI
ncbi:MAG: type III-A CRISPR-associated RAMP protein Csm4 [Pseudomonadota bacterium]